MDPSVLSPTSSVQKRRPAVGPRLRILLTAVFSILAVLGVNSAYLGTITFIEWLTLDTWQSWFYQWMFLGHLVLGTVLLIPFIVFAVIHMAATRHRKNRRAVRVGYALFGTSLLALFSGALLVGLRIINAEILFPNSTKIVYWAHVGTPLGACWLYWLHRLAGPRIRWRLGAGYLSVAAITVLSIVIVHTQDPRRWHEKGPEQGAQYFEPSAARTTTGNYIPADTLMMDDYCRRCHADTHARWEGSAHHFSSFNNPLYLASVRETRDVSFRRDGDLQAARWCAGCHDPVPFFSGSFDNFDYDDVNDLTAHAGITCTTCHAITHVNSTQGNADYTIEEPLHYPFAKSNNEWLQWVNAQLVKAKPGMHRKTFLKDFHRSAEFCSVCHKVSIPGELNHYKDFLRGQNHYDSFLLSGVSGHGARSFYYPANASTSCNTCHMPLTQSSDFGARIRDSLTYPTIHDHLFLGANTGVPSLLGRPELVADHQEFLKEITRVDVFGIRTGSANDAPLIAPLRPTIPSLKSGQDYVLETVIRTLTLGHHLTQGTTDSNEIWLDVEVLHNGQIIGRSGALDPTKGNAVDPWAHYVNVFMLDRNGKRIDRRNVQDIFVPLYNHQIPPGAAWTVHYGLTLPEGITGAMTIRVKLQYRKFDSTFLEFAAQNTRPADPVQFDQHGDAPYSNHLPITTLAEDTITFTILPPTHTDADAHADNKTDPKETHIDTWERWNDFGIGLLLKGKAELRQAEEAFHRVEALDRFDGPMNLARVYLAEGRIDEAADALARAESYRSPSAPPWTLAWLSGQVNRQQGNLEQAESNFRSVLEDQTSDMRARGFDFSLDYEVRNLLALTLYDRSRRLRSPSARQEKQQLLRQAAQEFEKTITVDSENVMAHYNLSQIYSELGNEDAATHHRALHSKYKRDDNASDRAVQLARERYPAANHASEAIAIYPLQREGAPGFSNSDILEILPANEP